MDLEMMKGMCCNLEYQQKKIWETYEEMLNTINLQEQIKQLQEQIKKLENNNQGLQEQIKKLENNNKQLEDELKSKDDEINELQERNQELQERNQQLQEQMKGIENNNKELEDEMKLKDEEIKELNEKLEVIKYAGNLILSTHNKHFKSLLHSINKIIYTIEFNTNNTQNNIEEDVEKNNIEMLIEINHKFVKLSLEIMKLLSKNY